MITQSDFVAECYSYYREMDYQPGNPEDGVWHKAHYPVPACKGGEDTILLLREHHAIQGVLQSGEYEYPCVAAWEGEYLPRYYIPAYRYWCGVRGAQGCQVRRQRPSVQVQIINNTNNEIIIAKSVREASRITGVGVYKIHQIIKNDKHNNNDDWYATYTPTANIPVYNDNRQRTPVDIHYPDGRVITMPSIYNASITLGTTTGKVQYRLRLSPNHIQRRDCNGYTFMRVD